MKHYNLLAVPTAKIMLGKNSVEIDTVVSSQGKKSYQISFMTDDDSLSKNLDETVEDIKNEIGKSNASLHYDSRHEDEDFEKPQNKEMGILALSIPIISVIAVFTYLMYNSYQQRKLKETMINNGMTPPDDTAKFYDFMKSSKSQNLEQKKYLKYAIIALSCGISYVLSEFFERFYDIHIFIGLLALCLGIGYLFIYQNSNNNPPSDSTPPTPQQ